MTTGYPFARGPFLSAAFLCEKVLSEADGVKSAIRIIDRVTHTVVGPNPPAEMQPFDYDVILFCRFKSGWTGRGPYTFKVVLETPAAETKPPIEQTIYFEGEEDRGIDVVGNIKLRVELPGIHWFHIYLNDTHLTQVPLRLVYLPQVMRLPGGTERLPPG